MNRKLFGLLIVLIFSLCCVGIAFAENGTGDDVENDTDDIEEIDLSNYILATSINNGKIKFNDGFTGFALDSSKEKITSNDPFSLGGFSSTKTENYVKLAIIEAYKQGRENNIASIVAKIVSGNLDTSDSVIKAVVDSSDNIGSSAVANIDNTTEATFTFELLKSASDDKSDCLAYKVSMRTVESQDIIGSADDGQDDSNDDKASSGDKDNKSQDNKTDENKQGDDTDTKDKQSDDKTSDDDSKQSDDKKAAADNSSDKKKSSEGEKKNSTTVNETNTTIVKNTTTVIENNTTIIHNNVKEVNNTTAPKNDTVSNLLKAGNPILILIIVIVVAVIAVVVLRRKG